MVKKSWVPGGVEKGSTATAGSTGKDIVKYRPVYILHDGQRSILNFEALGKSG